MEKNMIPDCSIIIPIHNNLSCTKACLASIELFTNNVSYELILIDNASTDGTSEYLKSFNKKAKLVLNNENLGFAKACNQGISASQGKYIILLNNDAIVTPDWLSNLVRVAEEDEKYGIVGTCDWGYAKELYNETPNYEKSLKEMGLFSDKFRKAHLGTRFEAGVVFFFCALIKRELVVKIGLLDESFGIGFFEDNDYCRRAKISGFKVVVAGDIYVHHLRHKTFHNMGIDLKKHYLETEKKYKEKWHDK